MNFNRHSWFVRSFAFLLLAACQTTQVNSSTTEPPDNYLWLEEIEAPKSLEWVQKQNARSLAELESLPVYKKLYKEVEKIVLAKDRLPGITYRANMVYNFWQDEKNVRGVWRRTTLANYKSKNPKWDVILDLDQLAQAEKENWVWKGAECLEPENRLCLVRFSRGGKDASVVREFDTIKKEFVKDGFYLPEAKSRFAWVDKDSLLVGTDYGPGSMTLAGYPRELRLIQRGQRLGDGKTILKIPAEHLAVDAFTVNRPEGKWVFVYDSLEFYSDKIYLYKNGAIQKIDKPDDAELIGMFSGQLLLKLRTPWQGFESGSLVSFNPEDAKPVPSLLFKPSAKQSYMEATLLKNSVALNILENVQGKIINATWDQSKKSWQLEPLPFPAKGSIDFIETDPFENLILVSFTTFLKPTAILGLEVNTRAPDQDKVEVIKSSPSRFNAKGMVVDQFESTSQDGTKIPYFVVRSKNQTKPAPTMISAYGGFEISETPYYLGVVGKVWLERGGVFVLANIRGGGEFGPQWHQQAVKENREKVFEDLISVAEDVIARKITTAQKLAIEGGSNGGLLVGATMLKRPDLFKAVICEIPLLDMLRYHKLLAGHSWMAEYGDPDDPKMREVILRYSPYQNVKAEQRLPEVFFLTSTKDDRVHPGHARKMAARMLEQKHPFLYYENTEGGHSGGANLNQKVKRTALIHSFLLDRLN